MNLPKLGLVWYAVFHPFAQISVAVRGDSLNSLNSYVQILALLKSIKTNRQCKVFLYISTRERQGMGRSYTVSREIERMGLGILLLDLW